MMFVSLTDDYGKWIHTLINQKMFFKQEPLRASFYKLAHSFWISINIVIVFSMKIIISLHLIYVIYHHIRNFCIVNFLIFLIVLFIITDVLNMLMATGVLFGFFTLVDSEEREIFYGNQLDADVYGISYFYECNSGNTDLLHPLNTALTSLFWISFIFLHIKCILYIFIFLNYFRMHKHLQSNYYY